MSNRDDQGGRRPPPDDRTLLDPLSSDELEQLRAARQRIRASTIEPADRSTPAVVGPESDPTLGDAPTRATPALPSFEGRVSLDQIRGHPESRVSAPVSDPASGPPGQAVEDSGGAVFTGTVGHGDVGEDPTLMPGMMSQAPIARATIPSHSAPPTQIPPSVPPGAGASPPPQAGSTGFGENTLMWMQPPRAQASLPPAATVDVLPPQSASAAWGSRLRSIGVATLIVLVLGAVVLATLGGTRQGVIELSTEPSGATVTIDGKLQSDRTPVKVSMGEGIHRIAFGLEGYEDAAVEVVIDPENPAKRTIQLEPTSEPGKVTVTISVEPVAALIELDGEKKEGKRIFKVPNVDPTEPHRINVSAPGYKSQSITILAGTLKASYTFVLQQDGNAPD